jgi:methionyl aminopeptidase
MSEFAAAETEHICLTPDCGKKATLSCPTCLKLSLPPSRFCSQTCFTGYFPIHKALHARAKDAIKKRQDDETKNASMKLAFMQYKFSGSLRPADQTPTRVVPPHIPRPDYADHPDGVSNSERKDKSSDGNIRVYTPEEIEGIRAACVIGRAALDAAGAAVAVGVTCDELDRIVHETSIAHNAYPSPLNYYNFPKSVCTSVNEVICHGIPDLRPLEDGDIVNIDVSVYFGGYHADLNETFLVGAVDDDSKKLVQCAYNTLAAAIDICKPGTLYRDVGNAITKVAQANQCSVVRSYCGHGVGELFHTSPNVPHYSHNKAKGVMQVGHVFTIEPMINLGSYQDVIWPDNWTAPTKDGKRSAQFEHTMVVTETGVELLTARLGKPTNKIVWEDSEFQR